jgi:hypothetical protein
VPGTFVFRQPSGALVEYVSSPVAVPPTTSKTYTNQGDGYAIDYVADWIVVGTSNQGHAGITLYPPGTDVTANVPGGPAHISIGWTNEQAIIPEPSDQHIADIRPITANGVTGQTYTIGVLGKGIVAVFPRKGGYVALSCSADSGDLIDACQRALGSLRFL